MIIISVNLLCFFLSISHAVDSITPFQSLTDVRILVSREGSFELGILKPRLFVEQLFRNLVQKHPIENCCLDGKLMQPN